jgi:hypothetical protein
MSVTFLTLFLRAIGDWVATTAVVQKSMQRPFFSQSP